MNRQITKYITSYFPAISKTKAALQVKSNFLALSAKVIEEEKLVEEEKEQKVLDERDIIINYKEAYLQQFEIDPEIDNVKINRVKEKRPPHWRDIVREYNLNGYIGLKNTFPDFLINESGGKNSENCLRKRISRYNNDIKRKTPKNSRGGQSPPYGMEIDNELYLEVKQRRAASIAVNDLDLRHMLVTLLKKNNLSHLLVENGGKYHFEHSWASRFCRRHDLVSRVPTSKARENPAQFDQKVHTYINVLSIAVHSHNVSPELVINCDETGLNFVALMKKTIETIGTRKVRMCGVGRDKAQITCTLACTESGNVLKPQLIFAGKTSRCCPTLKKNYLYSFTKNHWQNGESYLQFLKEVIVPYRVKMIKELNLQEDQWCILIHDLHYSHLDLPVKLFMKNHFIAVVHIPAGCTDSLQVCDTVINAPFKAGARYAFKDLVGKCYDKYVEDGGLPQYFEMNLNIGYLKDYISDFVAKGVEFISTPEMKLSIANAFKEHARLEEARSVERYNLVLEEVPNDDEGDAASGESDSSDTVTNVLGDSSSENDDEPLVLKLPMRFRPNGRSNLSINAK